MSTHLAAPRGPWSRTFALVGVLIAVGACSAPDRAPAASSEGTQAAAPSQPAGAATLTLGAYTTPREAYGGAILPSFRALAKQRFGRELDVRESYLGSGAQARAIAAGFEADVAALSLAPDIEQLVEAGLITHDWKAGPHAGMVTRSAVVIGVRAGNPKQIRDWQDLARPGVEVLTPNVRTSGGAMWNVLALYGAALRGKAGTPAGDTAAATKLLAQVLANVKIMDRGARESLLTFERGAGDAIITYENELLAGRAQGKTYEIVAPVSTILIENPVAVVDAYVERHRNRDIAEAFVELLRTPEMQGHFAKHGFRPVVDGTAGEAGASFAKIEDLFTVRDLGDWAGVEKAVFASGGVYDQALQQKGAP
jgi:sulfate transport system substrate-binding protein